MNQETANKIVSEIESLAASNQRQINVEFEGFAGPELPQVAMATKLVDKINNSGTFAYTCGRLTSKSEYVAASGKFNGMVKSYLAANPSAKGLPMETIKGFEKVVGYKLSTLKSIKLIFA